MFDLGLDSSVSTPGLQLERCSRTYHTYHFVRSFSGRSIDKPLGYSDVEAVAQASLGTICFPLVFRSLLPPLSQSSVARREVSALRMSM